MRKAVGYLRVSGKGQIEGDGFPRQKEAIQAWAKQNGIHLEAWYQEEGVTGTIESRPALARLLVDLEENHVDVSLVLVEGFHRLARELMVQENILADVWKTGRDVLPVDTGIPAKEDEDPSRTMIRQIMGAVAQYEKSMLVQKLAAARARKRERQGKCEGPKHFGHFPGEEEALQEIRRLRTMRGGKRLSYARIASALNTGGFHTRTGKEWKPGTVQGIVKAQMPGLA